jgi:FixJ family two-component response regulator
MADQRERIVIVEDDAGMSKAIERLLRAAGFQSLSFASAEALLAMRSVVPLASCLIFIFLVSRALTCGDT